MKASEVMRRLHALMGDAVFDETIVSGKLSDAAALLERLEKERGGGVRYFSDRTPGSGRITTDGGRAVCEALKVTNPRAYQRLMGRPAPVKTFSDAPTPTTPTTEQMVEELVTAWGVPQEVLAGLPPEQVEAIWKSQTTGNDATGNATRAAMRAFAAALGKRHVSVHGSEAWKTRRFARQPLC